MTAGAMVKEMTPEMVNEIIGIWRGVITGEESKEKDKPQTGA
jgi:hypothetical protein